jgi:hypothetical protein
MAHSCLTIGDIVIDQIELVIQFQKIQVHGLHMELTPIVIQARSSIEHQLKETRAPVRRNFIRLSVPRSFSMMRPPVPCYSVWVKATALSIAACKTISRIRLYPLQRTKEQRKWGKAVATAHMAVPGKNPCHTPRLRIAQKMIR